MHYNKNHDKLGRFAPSTHVRSASEVQNSRVLAKGSRLNSVSSKYINSDAYAKNGRWMYTYNPNDKWDTKVYEGPFSVFLIQIGAQFVKRHEYKTAKDLTLANSEDRLNEFKDLCQDKKYKKTVIKELEETRQRLVRHNIGNEEWKKKYEEFRPKKMDSNNPEDLKTAYSIFNHAMESKHAQKSTREYGKRLESKYDGMVDDNNLGVYNEARDPVIVFKADRVLESIGHNKISDYLTLKEIDSNYTDVKKVLNKKGKNIAI